MHATDFFLDYGIGLIKFDYENANIIWGLHIKEISRTKFCVSGRIAYNLTYLQDNTAKNRKFWGASKKKGVYDKEWRAQKS